VNSKIYNDPRNIGTGAACVKVGRGGTKKARPERSGCRVILARPARFELATYGFVARSLGKAKEKDEIGWQEESKRYQNVRLFLE
jgi:hypothetical protein